MDQDDVLIEGYCSATSVVAGESIDIHLCSSSPLVVTVTASLFPDGDVRFEADVRAESHPLPPMAHELGCEWPPSVTIPIAETWPSGVYQVIVRAAEPATLVADQPIDRSTFYFVVKPHAPGSPVLVALPVATYQAYNAWPSTEWPGRSLYRCDAPVRSRRVSFDRPGGWEFFRRDERFVRWLAEQRIDVDYCTSIDLHRDRELLEGYQLLLSIGHDEYWSKQMRDNVEGFIASAGNVAFFSGNTCWWQVRFEDDDRTLVCYKNAVEDPLTGVDDQRVTVLWHAAPVHRPENTLTGVSSRHGAVFLQGEAPIGDRSNAAYRVSFPEHWVFDGVDIDGDGTFGRGESIVGYETDAAEFVERDGVPLATGRDGTPESFVILAHADLSDWRWAGQAGFVTLGIYDRVGTVFTAGSVDWSTGFLHQQSAVHTITRNVIGRLSENLVGDWQPVGGSGALTAFTCMEGRLYGARGDGTLLARDARAQNLPWRIVGCGVALTALGSSDREATGARLLGVTPAAGMVWTAPGPEEMEWRSIEAAGADVIAITGTNGVLFGITEGCLWCRPPHTSAATWRVVDDAPEVVALAAHYGALFGITESGRLVWRTTVSDARAPWTDLGSAPTDVVGLGVSAGYLYTACRDGTIQRRACR